MRFYFPAGAGGHRGSGGRVFRELQHPLREARGEIGERANFAV